MRPAIILAIGAGLALASFGALAAPTRRELTLDDIYQKWGGAFGVDWRLLKAHAQVESSENPKAYNREGSSGLMQILLPMSKNTGARRHYQAGNLPEWDGADDAVNDRIFDPDYNVMLGASLIRENIRAYGLPRAIAVYNNDRARLAPQDGPFVNQGYVDKVLAHAAALGWTS